MNGRSSAGRAGATSRDACGFNCVAFTCHSGVWRGACFGKGRDVKVAASKPWGQQTGCNTCSCMHSSPASYCYCFSSFSQLTSLASLSTLHPFLNINLIPVFYDPSKKQTHSTALSLLTTERKLKRDDTYSSQRTNGQHIMANQAPASLVHLLTASGGSEPAGMG